MRAIGSTKPTSGRSPTPHRPTRASKDAPDGPTPPQGHATAIRADQAHPTRILADFIPVPRNRQTGTTAPQTAAATASKYRGCPWSMPRPTPMLGRGSGRGKKRKEGFLPAEYTMRVARPEATTFVYFRAEARRIRGGCHARHARQSTRAIDQEKVAKMGSDSDPHFRDTGTEMDWDSKNCAPSHSHTRAAGRRDHPPTTHHTTPAPYFTLNPQGQRERHVPRNAPVRPFAVLALGPRPPAPIRVPYVRVPAGCVRVGGHGRLKGAKGRHKQGRTSAIDERGLTFLEPHKLYYIASSAPSCRLHAFPVVCGVYRRL